MKSLLVLCVGLFLISCTNVDPTFFSSGKLSSESLIIDGGLEFDIYSAETDLLFEGSCSDKVIQLNIVNPSDQKVVGELSSIEQSPLHSQIINNCIFDGRFSVSINDFGSYIKSIETDYLDLSFSHMLYYNTVSQMASYGSLNLNLQAILASGEVVNKSFSIHGKDIGAKAYSDFHGVVRGDHHSCGLDSNGHAYCWGDNSSNQTGLYTHMVGYAENPATMGDFILGPIQLGFLSTQTDGEGNMSIVKNSPPVFSKLTAGKDFSCGLLNDGSGKVMCWGAPGNSTGRQFSRLGNLNSVGVFGSYVQKGASDLVNAIDLKSSRMATCAKIDEGTGAQSLYCWGEDDGLTSASHINGNKGNADGAVMDISDNLLDKVIDFFVQDKMICAIHDNTWKYLYCWGSGGFYASFNSSGLGSSVNYARAIKYNSSTAMSDVSAMLKVDDNLCAVLGNDKEVYCFGNSSDVTGFQSTPEGQYPEIFGPIHSANGVLQNVQSLHPVILSNILLSPAVCSLQTSGQVYCWGQIPAELSGFLVGSDPYKAKKLADPFNETLDANDFDYNIESVETQYYSGFYHTCFKSSSQTRCFKNSN